MVSIPAYTLNDGSALPAIGFGTYPLRDDDGTAAIRSALDSGYRLLDTAVNYENEPEVGEAIRRSGVPRDQVLIQTKIPGRHHAYDEALASIRASLTVLGVDHTDLHLIHWPNPSVDRYVEAWRALVTAQQEGLVTTIGVSNFTERQLHRVIDATGVTPAVNQLEMHPYFPQVEMRKVNAQLGIRTQAWSPLGKRQAPFHELPVAAAAAAHGVTPGQVILRWHHQLGSVPLPKSATPQRQRDNLDIFGFELTAAEVDAITALGRPDGRLFGGDPDTHEEM
ncbi:aldo/keto reductase [Flexivirga caeni]|uniref:Aldo/keto reductase n=1 Tax=Flexivirga caeni TaxID=2294115 RepID=A0A3M9M6F5_9MICO|nr:aldo/keto reductase [Flexivirga caeni]RNI20755.1 aldo/keto reductase [Flexivirga caeni]